jgi:hypothetical protein
MQEISHSAAGIQHLQNSRANMAYWFPRRPDCRRLGRLNGKRFDVGLQGKSKRWNGPVVYTPTVWDTSGSTMTATCPL